MAHPPTKFYPATLALARMAHSDVDTTMIYTHVLNRGTGLLSPLDDGPAVSVWSDPAKRGADERLLLRDLRPSNE